MMARMPDLSRRAVLRLGAGAATGALGAYALDKLLPARPPLAAPVTMTGTGVPLAPH
ncbi:MAG: alpha/beta hydrolase, partial [Mycobacterium sp.]